MGLARRRGRAHRAARQQGQVAFPGRLGRGHRVAAGALHSMGLKAGLYTSPGPKTCAGYAGAWQHEAQDAQLVLHEQIRNSILQVVHR